MLPDRETAMLLLKDAPADPLSSDLNILHSTVSVTVDRPLGSHHPKHRDMIYPVNYGYVEGIIAPDGEEQDAYVLGITEPLTQFTGTVIAIIRRKDDIEDKWVVVPEGMHLTRKEIYELVNFQEQYFDIRIVM